MELNSLLETRTTGIVREVTLDIAGHPCPAVVRPAGASPKTTMGLLMLQRMDESKATESDVAEATGTLVSYLAETVESWDVTMNGVPVATTVEGLEQLGFDFLALLGEAVQRAVMSAPKGMSSSSGKPTNTGKKHPRK